MSQRITELKSQSDKSACATKWPVSQVRLRPAWFPARQRLIGLVRRRGESYVLPPAVVRKAAWRE
jgi:hypothetical protein